MHEDKQALPAEQLTVEAVEEALINQLFASEEMTGNGITVEALPRDRVLNILKSHGRLTHSH